MLPETTPVAEAEPQLKPVAETLKQFQEHVAALEKTRSEETGGLKEQLALLMTASTATRTMRSCSTSRCPAWTASACSRTSASVAWRFRS